MDETWTVTRRGGREGWYLDLRITNTNTGARIRQRPRLNAKTEREATAEAARYVDDLKKSWQAGPKRAAFSGLAAKWLEMHSPTLKPGTAKSYRQTLRRHLVPHFGAVDVRAIDVEAVAELRAKLAETLRPKTVNNIMGVLSKILADGVDWSYLDANPCARVRPLEVHLGTPTWWTVAQAQQAIEWTRIHRPQWHLWLMLAVRTGLRFGELVALRWDDLQLDQAAPAVHVTRAWSAKTHTFGVPKGGRDRRVPLSAATVAALREVPVKARTGLVCPPTNASEVRSLSGATKLMAAVVKATRLPRIRVHDLRHSYCSQLSAAGVDLNLIRTWAGHVDFKTTLRYAHLQPLDHASKASVLDG